jgi:CRP/FNR family transcriptional regulator, cyclic AMP receptor protein
MLTVVEKVLFLQEVDVFEGISTEDLAHIAAITEEVSSLVDSDIYAEGDVSDSMYLMIDGQVRLHRGGKQVMIAKSTDVFGTWALFDDEPRVASATTIEDSNLLRIDREDFYDLLADHTKITQSVLKTLSKRLRGLLERVQVDLSRK